MRLSDYQARMLGIVEQGNGRARVDRAQAAQPEPVSKEQAIKAVREGKRPGNKYGDPQKILYDALCRELSDACPVWEKGGLVPGRAFRADIYLPGSRVVIEMDGFKYHRSKDAYQNDRKRQNLFVAEGYAPLRYFAAQVFNDLEAVIEEIREVHQRRMGASHENPKAAGPEQGP